MRRQGVGLLLLALMAGMFLSGCRSSSSPESPNAQQRPIVLQFWTLQLGTFADTLQPMIDAYEARHPNIDVQWVDIPFSEGEKRTLTAMLSPQAPDVVNLNPDFSALLASRRALLDMNQAVSPAVRQTYLPAAWQACTLEETGATFGVPWYLTSSVTIYNRRLLQQAGFQHPPDSLEALPAFAQKIRQKTGAYALMPTLGEGGNFLKLLHKVGIAPYDAAGKPVFADNGAAKVLAFWVSLYRQGWVPAESLTEGHRAAVDRYQAGTLALLLAGPNFLNIVAENAPAVYRETAVAPQFPASAHTPDFSTMLLAVPRRSQHPQEAVDFALFITNAANQLALARRAPVLPSVTAALQDPLFRPPSSPSGDLLAQARAISAAQLLAAKPPLATLSQQNRINEVVNFYVQSALLGKLSPQAAMARAQAETRQLLGFRD